MQMMEQSLTGSTFIPLLPHNPHRPIFPLKIQILHILSPHSSSSMLQLLHPVEGGACLEPFNLCLIEAVDQFQGLLAAVAVLHGGAEGLGRRRGRRDVLSTDAFQ